MRKLLVALALLGSATLADAATEQTILGKSLSIKDPSAGVDPAKRTIGFMAKEDASPSMIVGDPTAIDASGGAILEVSADGSTPSAQAFQLPQGTSQKTGKPFWSAVGTNGFKYSDPAGQNGPVTSVAIQRSASGTVTIKAKISGKRGSILVTPPNSGTTGCVALTLGMTAGAGDRYSVLFGQDSTVTNSGAELFAAKNPQTEGICDPCVIENGGCDELAGCDGTTGTPECGPCPGGYTGPGTECTDINECATNGGGCSGGFLCQNGTGTYDCNDINECATINGGCDAAATCDNTPGSRDCTCAQGYTGPGTSCTDINECAVNSGDCGGGFLCSNTAGSRDCFDINECATNGGGCTSGFACANSAGTFNCNDINECAVNNGGCATTAACANTQGSRSCTCNSGYTGPGTTCFDVNECATNGGGCTSGFTCANSAGTYNCNDVNECAVNNGGCPVACVNTTGGYNCQ